MFCCLDSGQSRFLRQGPHRFQDRAPSYHISCIPTALVHPSCSGPQSQEHPFELVPTRQEPILDFRSWKSSVKARIQENQRDSGIPDLPSHNRSRPARPHPPITLRRRGSWLVAKHTEITLLVGIPALASHSPLRFVLRKISAYSRVSSSPLSSPLWARGPSPPREPGCF